jgi:hypothetical protein
VVEDSKAEPLPEKPLLLPPRLPYPGVIGEDYPGIKRGALSTDGLKKIQQPRDGPPNPVAFHEGVREGFLAPAPRRLTNSLCQGEVEVEGHPRANW